jgi:type 1 glutamine amidotransferase
MIDVEHGKRAGKRITQAARRTCWAIGLLAVLLLAGVRNGGAEEIPAHQATRIESAVPDRPTAEPKQRRRVLIFVTPAHLMDKDPHKGYCIPYGTQALVMLGEKTGAFEPVVSGDLAMLLPENILQFDAIVLNNTSGAWITPPAEQLGREEFRRHTHDLEELEKTLRKSLLEFVRGGRGLAAIHFAIGANRHWPEFHEMLGATYAGHPWHEEVGIKIDEPQHPLVAAFGGKDFRLTEEIYQFADPYSREKLRVLLSLNVQTTNMHVPHIHRTDGDFALAWVRPFGKGRVFYTAFGHRTELYWHKPMLRFLLDGIQFAAGDLEAPVDPANGSDERERGFVHIFNGKDLTGWDGDERIWGVRDGAIVGQTTADTQLQVNSFLTWQGGQPGDFELRLKYKLTGGNSGIYFHANKQPEGEPLIGPQADFSADHRWTGVLMEWKGRDVLAERGQRVQIDAEGTRRVVGSLGDPDQLSQAVKHDDWNEYHVIVSGERRLLIINGVRMCEVTDQDSRRPRRGHIALQVHTGPPMTVQFKDIRIRTE